MVLISFCIVFLAFSNAAIADSDWTISGSDMYSAVSGDVGIGTSSPSRKLHINSSSTNIGIRLQSSDSMSYITFLDDSTSGDGAVVIGANGNDMQLKAGSSERIRISSSGNVGIGTTSPSEQLHVNSGADNIGLRLNSTDSISYITMTDNSTTAAGYVGFGADDDAAIIRAGDSERMRITSGGKARINLSTLPSTGYSYEDEDAQLYVKSTSTPDDEAAIKGLAKGSSSNPFGVWGVTTATGTASGQPIGVRGDAVEDDPTDGQVGALAIIGQQIRLLVMRHVEYGVVL